MRYKGYKELRYIKDIRDFEGSRALKETTNCKYITILIISGIYIVSEISGILRLSVVLIIAWAFRYINYFWENNYIRDIYNFREIKDILDLKYYYYLFQ